MSSRKIIDWLTWALLASAGVGVLWGTFMFSVALDRGEKRYQAQLLQDVANHKFDVDIKYCVNQCVDITLEKLNVRESQILGGAAVATMGVQQDPLSSTKQFCTQFYTNERCCSGYGIDRSKTVHGTDYGVCKP